MEIIKLIIGLGNHGLIYKNTRHNLGFITLEYLSSNYKIKLNKRACHSVYGNGFIEDKGVILAKPWTFMNLSGEAIKSLLKKFSFSPSEILVICDDFN
ncbi:MAG: aminoacyl-tRNA hydrolase, partial [Armatimonadetes bacterium]|nr:aminoacyl-tRNA hydrolase [Armatimonadota bacterium]